MFGRRVGSRVGRTVSSAPGFLVDDEACYTFHVIPGVTCDMASGKHMPMSVNEWALVYSEAGVPFNGISSIWNFQGDGSGGLLDLQLVGGAVTLNITGTGQTYQQPVTGWFNRCASTTDGGGGWSNTTVALNSALTSTLMLGYIGFPAVAPGSNRDIMSTALANTIQFNTTGKITANYTLPVNLAQDVRSLILPVGTRINNTAGTSTCFTTLEIVNGLYLLPALGINTTVGDGLSASGNLQYLYMVELGGPAAELTNNQLRALLQTLGWTVVW